MLPSLNLTPGKTVHLTWSEFLLSSASKIELAGRHSPICCFLTSCKPTKTSYKKGMKAYLSRVCTSTYRNSSFPMLVLRLFCLVTYPIPIQNWPTQFVCQCVNFFYLWENHAQIASSASTGDSFFSFTSNEVKSVNQSVLSLSTSSSSSLSIRSESPRACREFERK